MTKLTKNQSLAATLVDGAVLVSAAAGSGKTTVLVQRLINLLTDEAKPLPADRFLAVTFTNAAARGVAARINSALAGRIAAEPKNRFLRRQRLLMKRSSVSTVHAFCANVLREYFSAADIPADFAICDSLSALRLRASALEAALDELYADENSGIREFGSLFGRSRTDDETARLIEKLSDFESNLAFPSEWERDCLSELEQSDVSASAAGRFLLRDAKSAAESAKALSSQALELACEDAALELGYRAALEDDINEENRLLAYIEAGDFAAVRDELAAFSHARLARTKDADELLKARVTALRDDVKDILKKLAKRFAVSDAEYAEDCEISKKALKTLFAAKERFESNLLELKKKKRAFEFADLERLTLKLLCDENKQPTDIARELASRYDYILVDEYQDTNAVQDLIFELVSREGKNLFFVGDVKQSIYGFRRADPEIFVKRRERCHGVEAGLFPMAIPLKENFRSGKSVIEAVNNVFGEIMSREAGGADYGPDERLEPADNASGFEKTGLEIKLTGAENEPLLVADTIAKLLRGGYTVEDNGEIRPCRAGDFCVLLRSAKGKAPDYAKALEDRGVRAWTDTAESFFKNSEIEVFLSLLRVIDNPRREIELASVLMSPLYGASPTDVAELRGRDKRASFYALVMSGESDAAKRFLKDLKYLRETAASASVAELMNEAADRTGAEVLLCAGDRFTERRNNLRLLVDYARSLETPDFTLPQFLALCDKAKKQNKSISFDGFAPPDDAVCVISVHKSKGLEWPVVILADAAKQFNLEDSRDGAMLFDGELFAGLKYKKQTSSGALYRRDTLQYRAAAAASVKRAKSEEMRVLYVALTRAKQKLIVTAQCADPGKLMDGLVSETSSETLSPYAVMSKNSFLPWLLMPTARRLGEAAAFGETGEIADGPALITLCGEVDNAAPKLREEEAAADEALLRDIERRSSFVYKKRSLCEVPAKVTVSELSKDGSGGMLYRPSFSERAVSGAERGSAIHLFMQLADYQSAALSVESEIARLLAGDYIDSRTADAIDREKLAAFFESELGKKVTSSRCLREYAFVDAADAAEITGRAEDSGAVVMVQGIADCIVLEEDGAVLVDYKSDVVKNEGELVERYGKQLELYRRTISKRLLKPVKKSIIYSFCLKKSVEIC